MLEERTLHFKDELAERERLLASRGLSVPGGEDSVIGLFQEDRLIASGALKNGIIQGVAVLAEFEGQGFSSRIVSSIIRRAAESGLWHLFLFSKPEESNIFKNLGFSVAGSSKSAVLLEWGKPDINDYKSKLAASVEALPSKTPASCIVMNANPFTNGHRHLIETASAVSRHLFVLVVEEEASSFPFTVRFRLIYESVKHLSNVTVLGGGPYIVSSATFPSYFTDELRLTSVHAELDCTIFATHIVPTLSINRRFVGEEPYSHVTNEYNLAMKRVLPCFGVEIVEIPRLQASGKAVSASFVRQLIRENRLDETKALVPSAVWDFLTSSDANPILKKISSSCGRH